MVYCIHISEQLPERPGPNIDTRVRTDRARRVENQGEDDRYRRNAFHVQRFTLQVGTRFESLYVLIM